jgi:hypothetical protein
MAGIGPLTANSKVKQTNLAGVICDKEHKSTSFKLIQCRANTYNCADEETGQI